MNEKKPGVVERDSVMVYVRMPRALVAAVDRVVEAAGPEVDRSSWIRTAVRAALERGQNG